MMAGEVKQRKAPKPTEKPEGNKVVSEDNKKSAGPASKFGKLPVFRYQKVLARLVMIAGVFVVTYFLRDKEKQFATVKETLPLRIQKLDCSESYLAELRKYPGCVPDTCGRFVTDKLISKREAESLFALAKAGFKFAQPAGGASILDLHSGAISYGTEFRNIYKIPEASGIFNPDNILIYKLAKMNLQHAIAEKFDIDGSSIHLTHPTFFSRLTNGTAKTAHDEYWHEHIDKETYPSFHFTSLIYLSDYESDFTGGRFLFVENKTRISVEPKRGRVSVFTSGAENPHFVEQVRSGVRYALTVSFTCDKNFAIDLPQLKSEV